MHRRCRLQASHSQASRNSQTKASTTFRPLPLEVVLKLMNGLTPPQESKAHKRQCSLQDFNTLTRNKNVAQHSCRWPRFSSHRSIPEELDSSKPKPQRASYLASSTALEPLMGSPSAFNLRLRAPLGPWPGF